MANEAVLVLKYEDPIDFIVADGANITKGAILKLTSPRTAALANGARDQIAGIAARDKVANDGRTRLAVYRRGIFRVKVSGSVSAGESVSSHGNENIVAKSTAASLGSKSMGVMLEDATEGQVKEMELNIGAMVAA
jgi:ribosomal protein L35AE/L33A